eukprot:4082465-Prymnesium_polylepis.1
MRFAASWREACTLASPTPTATRCCTRRFWGGDEATALALVDAGAVGGWRAVNAQCANPLVLCYTAGLRAFYRRLAPSPGDHEAVRGALAPLLRAARDGDGAA